MKKNIQYKDGFTLIETVVAMLILSIIVAAYIALFTTSYGGIFSAGRKSEAIYDAQKVTDNHFANGTTLESDSLTVTFSDTSKNFIVKGKKQETTIQYEEKDITITSFIPKK